jgi:DNA-binding GntR family transcriptional regulator
MVAEGTIINLFVDNNDEKLAKGCRSNTLFPNCGGRFVEAPTLQVGRPAGAANIAASLEEEIALGHLAPRERLLEEELAERFQVKRHVIRQALLELDSMGIVVRQPNRGAAVKDFSVNEVEQLYLVRTLLETCAGKLIPLPAPRPLIEQLQLINERHCAAVGRGDLRRVFRENLRFHNTLFAACGNSTLTEVIEQLQFKTHAIRSYSIGNPQLLATVCAQHQRMIDLLQGIERDEFVELLGKHIQPAKQAYLEQSRHKTSGALAAASSR